VHTTSAPKPAAGPGVVTSSAHIPARLRLNARPKALCDAQSDADREMPGSALVKIARQGPKTQFSQATNQPVSKQSLREYENAPD